MSDLELSRYRRELERLDRPVREVAAALLGVPADRFLLLAPCLRQDKAPARFTVALEAGPVVYEAVPMTGVWGDGSGGDLWHGLHAFRVLTVFEQVGLLRSMNTRGQACTLWDTVTRSRASADGHPYLRVEDGWRTPREKTGGSVHMNVTLSLDDLPADARGIYATDTSGRDARAGAVTVAQDASVVSVRVRDMTAAIIGEADVFLDPATNELTVVRGREPRIGVGRNWRSEPPGWDWTKPLAVYADVTIFRADTCRDCGLPSRYYNTSGRCPACASIASGHGL